MGESRTELIQWLNELLQLNYTKIEQCGTGGAYCQILDSIYGDLPMNRVKMNAKLEYEYMANYKIMQNYFKAKKIDKPIPVEKLIKCKMQDNLEFMQWMKRFWDQNYGGHAYDPVARRRGAPADPPSTIGPAPSARTTASAGLAASTARVGGGRTPVGGPRATSTGPSSEALRELQTQVKDMTAHLEGLEKERDFYFAKLRDIEILVQQQTEVLEGAGQDDETLKAIQQILYSTEEGFEVPDGGADGGAGLDEEETF
jgi:RP/EB family microtubule-associated protein